MANSGPSRELHLLKAALLNPADSSFSRGHISGSINVPFSSAFGPDGEVVQCPATGVLQAYKGRVIVVISHAMKTAAMVRMHKHALITLFYSSLLPIRNSALFSLMNTLARPESKNSAVVLLQATSRFCMCVKVKQGNQKFALIKETFQKKERRQKECLNSEPVSM